MSTTFQFTNTTATSPDPEIIELHELYQALSWERACKRNAQQRANLRREPSGHMDAQIVEIDRYLANMRSIITVSDTWRS